MHFTYTEEGDKAVIDNQGDTALVVAKTDNTENHEELAQHTTAELGTGSDILDNLTGNNASVSGETTERLSPVQVAKALNNADNETDGKKMISGEQHENIKAILSAEFLATDIQRVTTAYLK